ncbi:hypothetical protein ACIPIX_05015 [Pseudomonas protegens]|uniref:hypothetical protein n=1 Tax=Pseudomonas protegens TaxID=380021 RepID=UPI0037F5B8B6
MHLSKTEEPEIGFSQAPSILYVDKDGVQIIKTNGPAPEGGIAVEGTPEYFDQVWLFPGWGPSAYKQGIADVAWIAEELEEVARQLDRLEEAEEGIEVADLLLGTRKQWLTYRGQLRTWAKGGSDFPDPERRPQRPE